MARWRSANFARCRLHLPRHHERVERRSFPLWLRSGRFCRGARFLHGGRKAQTALFASHRVFFRRRQQLSNPAGPPARALCEPRPGSIQRLADRLGPVPLRALGTQRSAGDDGKSAILCRASGLSIASVSDSSTLSSTTINQLLTNEVDATFYADVARITALRAIPHHRILVTPAPYFYALSFNVTEPTVKNLTIRRAFALAIDRHALVGKVAHGLYDADTAMRGLFTWAFDPRAESPVYDPHGARALLARDGWIPGADGIRVKNGRRLQLQLAFLAGSDVAAGFASLIVEYERAVGIDLTTKRYGIEEFVASGGPLSQGRFQVALLPYQSTYDPDASWLLSCDQRAPGGFNFARYCRSGNRPRVAARNLLVRPRGS